LGPVYEVYSSRVTKLLTNVVAKASSTTQEEAGAVEVEVVQVPGTVTVVAVPAAVTVVAVTVPGTVTVVAVPATVTVAAVTVTVEAETDQVGTVLVTVETLPAGQVEPVTTVSVPVWVWVTVVPVTMTLVVVEVLAAGQVEPETTVFVAVTVETGHDEPATPVGLTQMVLVVVVGATVVVLMSV